MFFICEILMAQSIYSDSIKLVVFELSSEEFGIDIKKIDSILRMQNITNIPYAAKFIEGIINYRGQPLVVVDLRKRFNLPLNTVNEENMRIIVLDFQPFLLGMIVDNVSEVLSLPFTKIEPVPDNLLSLEIEQEYLLGVGNLEEGERLIILLDLGKIFSGDELEDLGMLFGREHEIKSFLDKNRGDKEKQTENRRLAASQAIIAEEGNPAFSSMNYSSNITMSKEKYLEKEKAMIRKLALREIQEELGINLQKSSEEEEVVYLEEGEELPEEDGVEYVYVDEDGNEISAPADDKLLDSSGDITSPSDDIDDDVAALIAAAESDNESAVDATADLLDAPDDTTINNDDVAALIAAVESKKNAASANQVNENTHPSPELTDELVRHYEKYVNSLTKAKIIAQFNEYKDLSLTKKMKKATMVSTILDYLKENHPEIIIDHSQ
ncbi:hypothetical protein WKT22_01002 [Candidatus Lokiarchaeum ossiferum]